MEERAEVARLIPQQRIQRRTAEETVDILIPQIQEQTVEAIKNDSGTVICQFGESWKRSLEVRRWSLPVQQVMREALEDTKRLRQERVFERNVEPPFRRSTSACHARDG